MLKGLKCHTCHSATLFLCHLNALTSLLGVVFHILCTQLMDSCTCFLNDLTFLDAI